MSPFDSLIKSCDRRIARCQRHIRNEGGRLTSAQLGMWIWRRGAFEDIKTWADRQKKRRS